VFGRAWHGLVQRITIGRRSFFNGQQVAREGVLNPVGAVQRGVGHLVRVGVCMRLDGHALPLNPADPRLRHQCQQVDLTILGRVVARQVTRQHGAVGVACVGAEQCDAPTRAGFGGPSAQKLNVGVSSANEQQVFGDFIHPTMLTPRQRLGPWRLLPAVCWHTGGPTQTTPMGNTLLESANANR
jgi:hypothetical protein